MHVQCGSAQKIVKVTPATTMKDVLNAAMAHWGLAGEEWTLDWGEGEFVASDRMHMELRSANASEEVEVVMVMGIRERAVIVHSEPSRDEVQARAREAFGLHKTESSETQRARTGPYAPRERIEVMATKQKRGRAAKWAVSQNRITVHWRQQQ
jgi:hypothetical protein